MPDRITALLGVLLGTPAIQELIGTRAFPMELPDQIVNRMPLYAIVVRPAGGGNAFEGGYQELSEQRLDIHHYGGRPAAAYKLEGLVHSTLRQMPRTSAGDTLLHWAKRVGGPTFMREPGAGWPGGVPDDSVHWPFVVSSWTVLAADIALEVTP